MRSMPPATSFRIAVLLAAFAAFAFPASAKPPSTGIDAVPLPPLALVAPSENAVLPPERTLLIGRIAGGVTSLVRIEVNGKLATFAAAKNGGFHAFVTLSPGRNVVGLISGDLRATFPVTAAERGSYRFHPRTEECGDCHRPEGTGFRITGTTEAVCGRCHKGKTAGKYVHGPLGAGICTGCHDPHGSPFPRLRKHASGCFACHEPFPKKTSDHAPAVGGKCGACHDPHSSDLPAHLTEDGNSLCKKCHRNIHPDHRVAARKPGSLTTIPEDFPRSGEELACLGCHSAHRSVEKQLLKDDRTRLCGRCHRI